MRIDWSKNGHQAHSRGRKASCVAAGSVRSSHVNFLTAYDFEKSGRWQFVPIDWTHLENRGASPGRRLVL